MISADNTRMPLRSRLLAIPTLRAKYLQYVREIAEESLDWQQIAPVVAQHAQLIEKEVALDTRKLESVEAFRQSTDMSASGENQASLRSFFELRRKFLMEYEYKAESGVASSAGNYRPR